MKYKNIKTNKAFTLIELLVVVAIIGLLSSIILSSVNKARNNAKYAALKEGVIQFERVLALEYSDSNGSYAKLNGNGGGNNFSGFLTISSSADCDSAPSTGGFDTTSNYYKNAQAICKNIFNNSTLEPTNELNIIFSTEQYTNVEPVPGKTNSTYSIMAYFNGHIYCRGSNNRTSDNLQTDVVSLTPLNAGCWFDTQL
ncbi:MAG: type II secretion system protein [bacterium]